MRFEINDNEAANCQLPVIKYPTMKVTAMAISRQVMDLARERLLVITKTLWQLARQFRRCSMRHPF